MINPQQIKDRRHRLTERLRYLINDEDEDEIENIKREFDRMSSHERKTYANDLVQPGDNRFKTLYKEEWQKLEEKKEETYLKAKRIKAEQNKFYKKNLHEGRDKVTNVLNLEDKLRHA